jgi:parallel beta-helix repeat protein
MSKRAQMALFVTMLFVQPTVLSMIPSTLGPALPAKQVQYSANGFSPAQTASDPPLLIDGDDDMAGLGIPGDGSQNNPYIIEDLNISIGSPCIQIADVSAHFVIRNCFLRALAGTCLRITNVSDSVVENCILIGAVNAIVCENSTRVQLSRNTIYDTGDAIYVIEGQYCNISDNTIYACYVGVAFQMSRNCSCVDNTIYGNRGTGVDISADSTNNTIRANIVGWNSRVVDPWTNSIDRGSNNTWSGNFWSDYSPPGPYNLSGPAGAQDLDPHLLWDSEYPVINHTDEVLVAEGADVQIVWSTSDRFPLEYHIYVDGEERAGSTWTQSEISFDLSHLAVGVHDVVLSFTDAAGNEASHSVTVTVLPDFLSDIGTELVILASVVSVFSVVLVLFAVKKKL